MLTCEKAGGRDRWARMRLVRSRFVGRCLHTNIGQTFFKPLGQTSRRVCYVKGGEEMLENVNAYLPDFHRNDILARDAGKMMVARLNGSGTSGVLVQSHELHPNLVNLGAPQSTRLP